MTKSFQSIWLPPQTPHRHPEEYKPNYASSDFDPSQRGATPWPADTDHQNLKEFQRFTFQVQGLLAKYNEALLNYKIELEKPLPNPGVKDALDKYHDACQEYIDYIYSGDHGIRLSDLYLETVVSGGFVTDFRCIAEVDHPHHHDEKPDDDHNPTSLQYFHSSYHGQTPRT